MGRPKLKTRIQLFQRKGSPHWYITWTDADGKRKQKATKRKIIDYSRQQMQRLIESEIGVKRTEENTIEWLEQRILYRMELKNKSDKTARMYKTSFKPFKKMLGAGYSIARVNNVDVEQFQNYLLKKRIRPATVNTYCRTLRAAFERAYIDCLIDHNPFHGFERIPEPKDRKKHLTQDEARSLLNVLKGEAGRLMKIALFTGLRRSEILYIERADIDIKEGYFKAVNIKSHDKHKIERQIPEQVWTDFKYFMEKNPKWDYPFKIFQPDTFTHWAKKFIREAGLPEDLHLHSMRHTFITVGIEQGADVRDMQKYIDHSSINVTELYAHDKAKRTPKIDLQ